MQKKWIVPITTFTVGFSLVNIYTPARAETADIKSTYMIEFPISEKNGVFHKDKANAKKWSKLRYNTWTKNLSSNQKKTLEDFKIENREINKTLKEFRGLDNFDSKLNLLKSEVKIIEQEILKTTDTKEIDNLKSKINKINQKTSNYKKVKEKALELDKIIKQPVNQLSESQTIYTYFTAEDLGYAGESSITKKGTPNELDKNKINSVLKEYKYGTLTDLNLGELTSSSGEKGQRFVVELELPKGTYVGHLGDGKTVLPSGYAIDIFQSNKLHHPDNPKIIVENGKQIIKVKGKLIDKKVIQEKQKTLETKLNDMVKEKFKNEEFNKSSNFIKLDFAGLSTAYAMSQAEEAIKNLLNNQYLPKKLLKDTLSKLQNKDGIIFSDQQILEDDPLAIGVYNVLEKQVYIKSNYFINRFPNENLSTVLLHEIGHVVDLDILGDGKIPYSNNDEINNDFQLMYGYFREKKAIPELNSPGKYAYENVDEFFAEIFKSMYSPDTTENKAEIYHQSIEKAVPDAVKNIKDKLQEKGYL